MAYKETNVMFAGGRFNAAMCKVLWIGILTAGCCASKIAFAQTGDCCWIDAKTGERVPVVPKGGFHVTPPTVFVPGNPYGVKGTLTPDVQIDPLNPNQAHNVKTGQNYVKQSNGCWIDAQTGKAVECVPAGGIELAAPTVWVPGNPFGVPGQATPDVQIDPLNRNQAHNVKTGQNYVRVPCPPPQTAASTGL